MNTPQRKYSFYDIIVFKKTPNGYIDITNFSFDDKYYLSGNAFRHFECNSSYVLALWCGNCYLYSPVTISELLTLANVKQKGFVRQCKSGIGDSKGDDVLAMLCAGKIISHKLGCVVLKEVNHLIKAKKLSDTVTYEFMRKTNKNGKRNFVVLFEKLFKAGD